MNIATPPARRTVGLPILGVLLLAIAVQPSALAEEKCELVTKLLAPDGAPDDLFGWRVAMSGDVAVVAALDSRRVYIYRSDGTVWGLDQTLESETRDDGFAVSVDISGNTIVVGASSDDQSGSNRGAVHVYGYNGSTWSHLQKLFAADGDDSDNFGSDVAIDGEVMVVAAIDDADNGDDAGSAYVFRFTGVEWQEEQKLLASDGAEDDNFGTSVDVSGDTVVIGVPKDDDFGGASGSAYLFRYADSGWLQTTKLLASDGAAGDEFGVTVRIFDDVVLVGAYEANASGFDSGAAYVFREVNSVWDEEQILVAVDSEGFDYAGLGIAIDHDMALVSAYADVNANGIYAGAAYIYRFNGFKWLAEQKILAPDGHPEQFFGMSVALSGTTAIIGAHNDNDLGEDAGAAYVFAAIDSDCNVNGTHDNCDIAEGTSSDTDGDGVPDECAEAPCDGDVNLDGIVDPLDAGFIQARFGCQVGKGDAGCDAADQNTDGQVDPLDVGFVLSRLGGCPTCEIRTRVLPTDGAEHDQFGYSVAISTDVVVFGAPHDGDNGPDSGSAYVFRYNGSDWIQEQKLLAPDGHEDDYFGYSVAAWGDLVLVGAYNNFPRGAAYLFRYGGDEWSMEEKFQPPLGTEYFYFGFEVALQESAFFIGSPGKGPVSVYQYDGSGWTLAQIIDPTDGDDTELFGFAIALYEERALISEWYDHPDDNAIAVYRYDGTAWIVEQFLKPMDGDDVDLFGTDVAIDGNVAVIGAQYDDSNGSDAGSAYVFQFDGSQWSEDQKLFPSNGSTGEMFGQAVAVSGDTIIIGSFDQYDSNYSGSAYVFRHDGATWIEEEILLPAEDIPYDGFGVSVAMDGDAAAIGAIDDYQNWYGAGSGYLFFGVTDDCNDNGIPNVCDIFEGTSLDCDLNGIPDECEPDCNGNETADACDIAAGTSIDCTDNTIPDECEPDCNDNAVADSCDIAAGTSLDCNANGVPDACDLAGSTSLDCNANAVPDECDIGTGVSQDCNANMTPDECDLDDGTSGDCNENAIPDECDNFPGGVDDCNRNGVPDYCDILGGISEDEDADGIPDECEPCAGDVNEDGTVNPLDSGFVLARLGCDVGGGDPDCDSSDQNGDGVVDPLDVGFVLGRFGECR